MILDKLFQLMAEKQASDIFISAGAPIHIKIQGNTMPVNQQVMDCPMIEKIAYELMSPDQIKDLRGDDGDEPLLRRAQRRQLPGQHLPPARLDQRSSCASSSATSRRSIRSDAAGAGRLIMEKRGLILIVGATGSGKSTTIASMLDHRNANRSGHILTVEDPIEFLFKHKKSIVNQREIGMDTLDWESR
jgi:twitching motility protein PilU